VTRGGQGSIQVLVCIIIAPRDSQPEHFRTTGADCDHRGFYYRCGTYQPLDKRLANASRLIVFRQASLEGEVLFVEGSDDDNRAVFAGLPRPHRGGRLLTTTLHGLSDIPEGASTYRQHCAVVQLAPQAKV
jgi:hypothetical protein